MTTERANAFDFFGPQALIGPELKPGDKAPDFTLAQIGTTISGAQFAGKPLIISVIPSIDTGVCSTQTRHFNEAATQLGDDITVLTVSADLPFAQKRWCGAEGIERVVMGSDYLDMNFGSAYGTHIKTARLESRAAFVVDRDGVIRYAEYVPTAGQEPNYDAVIAAAKDVLA